MHKYNDGLDNETVRQVITTYRKPYSQQTVDIISNLGTEVVEKNLNSNYNSNLNVNENMNVNMNTFRQIENDCAPEAHLVPEKPLVTERPENNVLAFGGVMAAQPKTQPSKKGFKRLNTQAIYNEINVQVSNIRDMGRYMRCRIHVSLKEDIDRSYSVFLSGAATSSKYELIAGAKDNEQVLSVINNFMTRQPGCMIARFHYKPVKGFITDFHKKNLKSAIMMIYEENDVLVSELYLLGEYINIPLDKQLTKKQQQFYSLAGLYKAIPEQMTDEEEFE